MLDRKTGSVQAQSIPPHAGTKHLLRGSRALFGFRGAHASGGRILLAHVRAGFGIPVTSMSSEVIDVGLGISPNNDVSTIAT